MKIHLTIFGITDCGKKYIQNFEKQQNNAYALIKITLN